MKHKILRRWNFLRPLSLIAFHEGHSYLNTVMGQGESKVRILSKPDPCKTFLDNYTDCVAKHDRGLSDGDDCGVEGAAYKECRRIDKLNSKNKNSNPNF